LRDRLLANGRKLTSVSETLVFPAGVGADNSGAGLPDIEVFGGWDFRLKPSGLSESVAAV
jgi:hypothetical protein